MSETDRKRAKIVARAWTDPSFKSRLLSEPKAVLAEYDLRVPDGVSIEIVENNDEKRFFVLPMPPKDVELTADDLDRVAGGDNWMSGG